MRKVRSDSLYLVPRYNWIAAAVGAAASIGSAIYNMYSQKKNNDRVEDFTREQFDYNRQLNNQLMQREDTAYQRAVSDARAAGLSPLTVAGTGGAGSGGTVSQSNLSLGTQAPQIEPNTFLDAMRSLEQESMQKRQLDAQSKSQDKQIDFESMKLQTELDAQNEMLDKQIQSSTESQDKQLAQELKIFNSQQNTLLSIENAKEASAFSREAMQSAKSMGITNFKYYANFEEYQAALQSRSQGASDAFMSKFSADPYEQSEGLNSGFSDSSSNTVEGSVSAGASVAGIGAKSGFGASDTVGSGSSENAHYSKSRSGLRIAQEAERDYWNKHGYPVFIGYASRSDVR